MVGLFKRLFRERRDFHFTKEQVRYVVRHEALKQRNALLQEMTLQNAAILLPRIEALEKIMNEE